VQALLVSPIWHCDHPFFDALIFYHVRFVVVSEQALTRLPRYPSQLRDEGKGIVIGPAPKSLNTTCLMKTVSSLVYGTFCQGNKT
jgi:hypothetical protein